MAPLDYNAQGFKDIIVTLDGAVAVILINRTNQYVSSAEQVDLFVWTHVRPSQEKLHQQESHS